MIKIYFKDALNYKFRVHIQWNFSLKFSSKHLFIWFLCSIYLYQSKAKNVDEQNIQTKSTYKIDTCMYKSLTLEVNFKWIGLVCVAADDPIFNARPNNMSVFTTLPHPFKSDAYANCLSHIPLCFRQFLSTSPFPLSIKVCTLSWRLLKNNYKRFQNINN